MNLQEEIELELAFRKAEMMTLRYEQGLTLKEIGARFNVSRERVRQIVGSNGFVAAQILRKRIREYAGPMVSNKELAEKFNISESYAATLRDDWHVANNQDSSVGLAKDMQLWAKEMLEKHGYDVELVGGSKPYHLMIGTLKIAVSCCSDADTPPSQIFLKSPRWRFNVRKFQGRESVDIYILICLPEMDFFVVPTEAVPMGKRDIIFCYPTLRPEIGKYQQYHKDVDQIYLKLLES